MRYTDDYKLQIAIYRVLLFGEDVLIVTKGEKEMECKNLTRVEGGKATANLNTNSSLVKLMLSGPIVDRLHEFEKLGYEPEEIRKRLNLYSMYRLAAHSMYGSAATYQDTDSLSKARIDAIDTLYYAFKAIGDMELSRCDDIRAMYPSTVFTEAGFSIHYATNKDFRKLVEERIKRFAMNIDSPSKMGEKCGEIARNAFDDAMAECDEYIKNHVKWDLDITKRVVASVKNGAMIRSGKYPWGQSVPEIKNVIFNKPATIVFWSDGDKTVVKAQDGEPYDPEKGIAMAIAKKALGNNRNYWPKIAKHLKAAKKQGIKSDVEAHLELDQRRVNECLSHLNDDHSSAMFAYDALKAILDNPKATKAQIVEAVSDAVGHLGEILA